MPKAGDGAPWFKCWAVRWFNSLTVAKMSDSERGIFIQILVGCWIFGELPRDCWILSQQLHMRYSTTAKWMRKYASTEANGQPSSTSLVVNGQSGCSHFAVPKLDVLQDLQGKSTPDVAGEKSREEKELKESKSNSRDRERDNVRSFAADAPKGAGFDVEEA